MLNVEELNGKTLTKVTGCEKDSDEVRFYCSDGSQYLMYHSQDCCESVLVEDVIGDAADLQDALVIEAREESNTPEPYSLSDSYTWTFYRIQTNKGCVVLRWLGTSNGYYSESVNFEKVD